MNPGELPPILTVEETAAFLRIGRATAYRAVRRGELAGAVRVGKTVRVYRDRLLAWLEQGQAPITRRKSA